MEGQYFARRMLLVVPTVHCPAEEAEEKLKAREWHVSGLVVCRASSSSCGNCFSSTPDHCINQGSCWRSLGTEVASPGSSCQTKSHHGCSNRNDITCRTDRVMNRTGSEHSKVTRPKHANKNSKGHAGRPRPNKGHLNIRNTKAHVAQDDLIHNHERLLTSKIQTELPGPARPPKPSQ